MRVSPPIHHCTDVYTCNRSLRYLRLGSTTVGTRYRTDWGQRTEVSSGVGSGSAELSSNGHGTRATTPAGHAGSDPAVARRFRADTAPTAPSARPALPFPTLLRSPAVGDQEARSVPASSARYADTTCPGPHLMVCACIRLQLCYLMHRAPVSGPRRDASATQMRVRESLPAATQPRRSPVRAPPDRTAAQARHCLQARRRQIPCQTDRMP